MRVLIVKTSSMGDVLHTLPALTDAAQAIPGIRFDWVVEEGFAQIPSWHESVERVIPVAIRRWRKAWFSAPIKAERQAFREAVQAVKYDAIIDAQGLVKSAALVTRLAHGVKHGMDWQTAREPLASLFYNRRHHIAKQQHAVERTRELFAKSLGYAGAFFWTKFGQIQTGIQRKRTMLDNTRLRIAIQKSGRLSEDSRELLSRCGIKVNLHTQRLIALAENMPIDILRVRDDDIPGLVMDGVVDLGIIGENVLEEELLSRRAQGEDPRYFTLRRLDFGGCRLSLATPVDEAWNGPAALDGKRIATSYPHLLKRYLDQKGISFKSCLLNGSVEVAPRAGLADAICDLVSTGATLEANGLREVEVIYRSKACLIQRDGEMADAKQQLIDRLLTRIQGVIQARESKYIMMHAPTERLEEVVALLPGAERPTILPLAGDKQRVAMHMVSSETLFWETMEKLKALGASSILVLPIEKMME